MTRVIAGTARGTTLEVAKSSQLRPTGDRQRETLFNVLRDHLVETRVLDLFAGTGALGIEALSRGAAHAVFVERDRRVAASLRRNLERCRLADRAEVTALDWRAALRQLARAGATFDLVLADPPWADDAVAEWLTGIAPLLAADGLLCLERRRGRFDLPDGNWALRRTLEVGATSFHLLQRSDVDAG